MNSSMSKGNLGIQFVLSLPICFAWMLLLSWETSVLVNTANNASDNIDIFSVKFQF